MLNTSLGAVSCSVHTAAKKILQLLVLVRAFVMIWLMGITPSGQAGQLILKNTGNTAITCLVDGFTVLSGSARDVAFTIPPAGTVYVTPSYARPNPIISSATCGQLQLRILTVTPKGLDQTVVLNGQQTRVLNVALYPYLPLISSANLMPLANYIVSTFQSQNPQVLLNLNMDGSLNIYDFDGLSGYLGANGFDVMELDMMFLSYLVQNGLINPQQQQSSSDLLPVAINASSYNGVLYGIPSWLCMDFIYSANPGLQNVSSLSKLQAFLAQASVGQIPLVGDFNGSWRLPAIYVNAYVQKYGYANMQNAFNMPPDGTVIQNLAQLISNCVTNNVTSPCIDKTYHEANNVTPGVPEQVLTHGDAFTDVGFSEQYFYMGLAGSVSPLYAVPMPWGPQVQPLLYADSFVTNSTTCQSNTQCAADAATLISLMTGMPMKNYIVQSQDYGQNTPWRTLLVPYQSFNQQPAILNNPMYAQYTSVFSSAQAFPNSWTALQKNQMGTQICTALQVYLPTYECNSTAAKLKTSAESMKSRQIMRKRAVPATKPLRAPIAPKIPRRMPHAQETPERVVRGRF